MIYVMAVLPHAGVRKGQVSRKTPAAGNSAPPKLVHMNVIGDPDQVDGCK